MNEIAADAVFFTGDVANILTKASFKKAQAHLATFVSPTYIFPGNHDFVPADYKVARAKEVMSYECNHPDTHFWWWADALYMVMPVMTKMYCLTGEEMYLDKLYENFIWSDSLMWDKDEQLYYRDGKYIWPKVTTSCDGGKSFWARGDGWVLAGLAKVLADMGFNLGVA